MYVSSEKTLRYQHSSMTFFISIINYAEWPKERSVLRVLIFMHKNASGVDTFVENIYVEFTLIYSVITFLPGTLL